MSGGPDSGKKVVGVGLACLDRVILWRDMRASVADNKILDFQVQGGGMVGTAMVAVARLGGKAEFWGLWATTGWGG
jgi:sugar/nucleoside kinase (ribokinase family)